MRDTIHKYLYVAALCIIAFFLPLSEYISNAAIFLLLTNWVIEANFVKKWKKLILNPAILVFTILFIVHVIWLINSKDVGFGLHDIKIKLPLLALPIIIGTSRPLSKKTTDKIVAVFVMGVLISTLTGLLVYWGLIQNPNSDNVRNISYFVSHIRLSLMICLSALLLFRFINERKFFTSYKIIIAVIIIIWFVGFLMMIQGFTGLISLVIVGLISLGVKAFNEQNRIKKTIYFIIVIGLPAFLVSYLGVQIKTFYTPSNPVVTIETSTKNGNNYYHNLESGLLENGNLIYINICEKELYSEWKKRSNLSLDSKDAREQSLLHTLIRYLTSYGLTKDANGISQLSDKDIVNIEKGNTNYKYIKHNGVSKRIYNIIWEIDVYSKNGNPSGHSITQRFEYLKAGLILSYRNIWCGAGTGDIDNEYKALYIEKSSQLDSQYRHRAHNQFLTFFVSFGVIGAFLCFFAFFYPIISDFKFKNYLFAVFILIAILSMLTDDTLETTTGVVFISYFYSLFLWGEK